MKPKTRKIVALVIGILPSLMVAMSAFMKLSGNPQMVDGFTKMGMIQYLKVFGIIEVVSLILFFYPKTYKIGFLLLCCYLGGAMSIELEHGQPPMSALLIALYWISVFIKEKNMFLPAHDESHIIS
ncbi:MAG TPA: DoxX family protein [Bacteroidia bacterium]|jgi:hypothetical protein|nr:DoxX family protein [Bacteroidia bacterium]